MGTDRAEHDSGDHSEISVNFATHLKSSTPPRPRLEEWVGETRVFLL